MRWIVGIVVVVIVFAGALGAWVRLAPSDPGLWHRLPQLGEGGPGDYPGPNSFAAVRDLSGDPGAALAALDAVAMATSRTERLAGSVEDGFVTYVTRSRLWGFPDFTTVFVTPAAEGAPATLTLWARARFGQSDLGVNRTRVIEWLSALPDGTLAP